MARRVPDHFNRRAHDEGYAARSVYKLQELDKRFSLLKGARRVVDLGCCPGSWSQLVARQGGAGLALVGVDIQPTPGYPGHFIHGSMLELAPETILAPLGGPADLVLSDMAPSTSGARDLDHMRQIELAEMARDAALTLLRPGGSFVVKVFEGGEAPAYVASLRAGFSKVKRVKPKATRGQSVEFFVVAEGRRGA